MRNNKILLMSIMILFVLASCKKEETIQTKVYKKGAIIRNFYGTFYTTKYGGLNYYISDESKRNELFNLSNIDSVIFFINKKQYSAKPLVRKAYSREKNNSDFSFSVDREKYKIIVDTIDNMSTLSIFSEKIDMEKMKDDGVIKCTFVGEKDAKK